MKIFFKENKNFLYEIIIGLFSKTGSDKTMANEDIKVFFKLFCFTQSVSIKVSYKVYTLQPKNLKKIRAATWGE